MHRSKVLLLVDPQEKMMPAIVGAEPALKRMRFLAECARLLGISVLSTRQNPDRLGDLVAELEGDMTFDKMSFSAYPVVKDQLGVVEEITVVGVETHICIYQTVRDLRTAGHSVHLAADATGARTIDRHELGIQACRDQGAVILHSEAIVYDWLESANHSKFRDVLGLVKAQSG